MKTNIKNILKKGAMAMALALCVVSCKDDTDENVDTTVSLTLVNTVEGSSNQDFYLNDSKSNSNLSYGSSASISTTTGTKTAVFKNTGSTTANATTTVNITANSNQSLFFVKQADGSYSINAYANENASTSGKAKVRFINVSSTLLAAVNVTTSTGTSLVSALAFKAASAYQTIDANTSLNVNTTGSLETTTISGTEFQAGKVYTVWFDSATTTKVKYHIIVQN